MLLPWTCLYIHDVQFNDVCLKMFLTGLYMRVVHRKHFFNANASELPENLDDNLSLQTFYKFVSFHDGELRCQLPYIICLWLGHFRTDGNISSRFSSNSEAFASRKFVSPRCLDLCNDTSKLHYIVLPVVQWFLDISQLLIKPISYFLYGKIFIRMTKYLL